MIPPKKVLLLAAFCANSALASVSLNVGSGTMYSSGDTSTAFPLGGRINFLALESGTWDALPAALGYANLNEVFANLNSGFAPTGARVIGTLANDDSSGPGVTGGAFSFSYSGAFNAGDQLIMVAYPTLTTSSSSPVIAPGFFFRTDSVIDSSDIAWVAPADGGTYGLWAYTQDLGYGSLPDNAFTSGLGASGGAGFGPLVLNVAAGQKSTNASSLSANYPLVKSGAGTQVLSGNNTFKSDVYVNQGTLVAGSTNALGRGAVTVATGAVLDLANNTLTNSLVNNGGSVINAGKLEDVRINGGTTDISGSGSRIVEVSGDAQVNLSGNNTTITNFSGGTVHVDGDGTVVKNYSGGGISVSTGREVSIESGSSSGGISGNGGVRKTGAGTLVISGNNTYSGQTTVAVGDLRVNGSAASSAFVIQSAGNLGGSGKVGAISGSGSLSPGNSPGILEATSLDPSGGLSFNYEFTGLNPVYSNASASVNDLLRLTAATPFVASLASLNTVNVYFNLASISQDQVYKGAFFTDQAVDFLSSISAGTYNFYVKGDGSGTDSSYNGQGYYSLANYNPSLSIGLATVSEPSADFSGGTVSGRVTQLTVLPEPSTYALLASGAVALALIRARRRHRG